MCLTWDDRQMAARCCQLSQTRECAQDVLTRLFINTKNLDLIYWNPYAMQYIEYRMFKLTNCTINNKQSFYIYDVSPACFGLYIAIITEAVCKGIQTQQILLNMCMCRVKYNTI